jgi:hypothetical protein
VVDYPLAARVVGSEPALYRRFEGARCRRVDHDVEHPVAGEQQRYRCAVTAPVDRISFRTCIRNGANRSGTDGGDVPALGSRRREDLDTVSSGEFDDPVDIRS